MLSFYIWLFLYFTSYLVVFFFFKQNTAYEMRISDWSSDVCASDLRRTDHGSNALGISAAFDQQAHRLAEQAEPRQQRPRRQADVALRDVARMVHGADSALPHSLYRLCRGRGRGRTEEGRHGHGGVGQVRFRWLPSYYKKKNT